MEVEFDRLKRAYLDEIMEIERACFSSWWSRALFEAEIGRENAFYIVAVHRGRAVGYAGMLKICGEGHILNVAVHPDCRRNGIAEKMIRMLIAEMTAETAAPFMTLEVRRSNTAAQSLYKKLGFKVCGERKRYYDGKYAHYNKWGIVRRVKPDADTCH